MKLKGKRYSNGVVYLGDCLNVLRQIPDEHYSAIITDPPYGISYGSNVGIDWDDVLPSKYVWQQCFRVLKKGGILLCFGGARTFHRITCQIEDAGFNIKDVMMWIYGEGFPKSHNISMAIDKKLGAERQVYGHMKLGGSAKKKNGAMVGGHITNNVRKQGGRWEKFKQENKRPKIRLEDAEIVEEIPENNDEEWLPLTRAGSPIAQLWEGYGTTLKPAYEPICVALKPMDGSYADNAMKVGVSGLNIDGGKTAEGRWPSNLMFDEDEARVLNKAVGPRKQGGISFSYGKEINHKKPLDGFNAKSRRTPDITESKENTSVSRYYYCTKPKRKERGDNPHPTVKPVDLMKYLIKLVKMPVGTKILDPFAGSGTTLHAAKLLGVQCDGVEMQKEYFNYIIRRLKNVEK